MNFITAIIRVFAKFFNVDHGIGIINNGSGHDLPV